VSLFREATARGAKIVCTTVCFLAGYEVAGTSAPLETDISSGLRCSRQGR